MDFIDRKALARLEPITLRNRSNTSRARAAFDSARTTDANRKHWANADALSPDAATTPHVRRTVARRARYEVGNNSYARGIVSTIANDTVGTGPTLQMLTADDFEDDGSVDELVETVIGDWLEEIGIAEKLRVGVEADVVSGEVFFVAVPNPNLRSPIKIDLRVVEAERVADPFGSTLVDGDSYCDGIEYDAYGNPAFYRILKDHPGSVFGAQPGEFDRVPAKYVFHLFRQDRPGQRRGLSKLTPALYLFALLRRYTLATVSTAEVAARHTTVIETNLPPDFSADTDLVPAFKEIELDDSITTALPAGYKMSGFKPEQPITNYADFVNALLREIARCLNVPFTIAAMDSSKANLSSAYLDREGYAKDRQIGRGTLARILDWLFSLAWDMAAKLPQFDGLQSIRPVHTWLFTGLADHADPQKTANAAKTRLGSGLTDLATELARSGRRADKVLKNQARVLGISVKELQQRLLIALYPPLNGSPPAGTPPTEPIDPEEETTNEPTAEET